MSAWQNPGIKVPSPNTCHTEVRRAFKQVVQKLGISSNNVTFGQPIPAATALQFLATAANKSVVTVALSDRLNGTSNQVILTDNSDGTFTLSLPQSINAGATPEFAGLTLTGLSGILKATAGVISGSSAHVDLASVTSDQHHAQVHTVASHVDTTATGAQLDTLVGGGSTTLHSHAVELPAGTEGDILYRNDSGWVVLAKGTAGQVLTMNAGATAPEWA